MGTLAATTTLTLTGSYTNTLDLTSPREAIGFTVPDGGQKYTNGTGANQANAFFADKRTVTGASETIDLTADLSDAFGTTLVFTKIKELIIYNTNTATGKVLDITGNALTDIISSASPKITIGPSGVARFVSPVDGFTITNTTQDQLTIDPSTDTITYWLIIIGTV